jgi:two-component system response regulator FixJ
MPDGDTGARCPIYIFDDDEAYRASLERLLASAGWDVSSFASIEEFVAVADDLQPGSLLLDVRMPGIGGLDLLATRSEQMDKFTTVVVTGHGDVEVAVRSLKLGAIDFLEKPFDPRVLLRMLESTAGAAVKRAEWRARERAARTRVEALSRREREVLCGMMAGGSNKIIARQLKISDRTVEMHRARMLAKLGVQSSAEAIQLATLANLEPIAS